MVQGHGVAFAHDARGTDGTSEKIGRGGGAVGLEDEFFGGGLERERGGKLVLRLRLEGGWSKRKQYLCLRVVLALLGSADDGPALVGVDEIGLVITHDTGGAGIDEGSNSRLLARLDDGGGAIDIDLLEERMRDAVVGLGRRRRGVDDNLGLDLVEDSFELVGVGDVGIKVLDTVGIGPPVARAAEIDDRYGADVVAEENADNVVTEEATAANYQDRPKVRLLF